MLKRFRERYRSLTLVAQGVNSIQVRTSLQAGAIAPAIRLAIRRVDSNLFTDTRSIAEIVDRAIGWQG